MRSFLALVLASVALLSTGCTTLRGRADDALTRGDYRQAVDLYTKVLADDPTDAETKAKLTRAERGLLDQALDRFDGHRKAARHAEAMASSLAALETKDKVHAEAFDAARQVRVASMVSWVSDLAMRMIRHETFDGRALAARGWMMQWAPLFARAELAPMRALSDEEIARAGTRTCERATTAAAGQPFSLELVAAYCKEVDAPLPAWKPRPFLVSGITLTGGITGTPPDEQEDLHRAVASAVEQSVWFSPIAIASAGASARARAAASVQGSVSARFTAEPTELSRSWTESVPYEATETYSESVQVPYSDTETYTEQVPYNAFEERLEPCRPPRNGLCNRSRPVTRMRTETRTRPVTKFRTEYVERTRQVTRYRDEPRVFRFAATKHEGSYAASHRVLVDLGGALGAVTIREAKEDSRVAYEHDAHFPPAGVSPEGGEIPSARSWREGQRARLTRELRAALDQSWVTSFCGAGASSIEEAARCVHGRPARVPEIVRARVAELINDDPDRVLALPVARAMHVP